MLEYTTKLEINVLRGSEVSTDFNQLSTFVIKNRIPAVVTEPEYIETLLLDRNKHLSKYKIICAVDFWDGRKYAMEKIRDLPQVAMMADGFEILVSRGRSDKEALNELRALTEFFRNTIDRTKEIRWALALRTRPPSDFMSVMEHMRKWPASFIRTDVNVDSPAASTEIHAADIAIIRQKVATPIKISGNIDIDVILALYGEAARFDVSLPQARRILSKVREMNREGQESIIYAEEVKDATIKNSEAKK